MGDLREPMTASRQPFLRRVRIRNYKSIEKCDLKLSSLTILVGRNGAGKSNFIDALRFVADALKSPIEHALQTRGGIDAVRRKSIGHPHNFAIWLQVSLPSEELATYTFEVTAKAKSGFEIRREQLELSGRGGPRSYLVESGRLMKSSENNMPPLSPDRLYLTNASGLPVFRPLYDALSSMGFYNLNPDAMKELQNPDAGELLRRDGSNIASVVARLKSERPKTMDRIDQFLGTIVPGIVGADRLSLGPRETLQFKQTVEGAQHPWKFYATNMSDGTLRAFGTLVAVTQLANGHSSVSLVGIEEPETALHPAAAAALMDALREAAELTQVIVTTHSPELLDQVDPSNEALLVVVSEHGNTRIAPIDKASREALQRHLSTPGELLRWDQLEPNREDLLAQMKLPLKGDAPERGAPARTAHR
jgi:predicted ATPase